jgi:hypothetical protein
MLSGQAELPKTCALLLTFFPPLLRVRSEIKSPYMPFGLIFCNIYTSYNRHSNAAKRKSIIVRFVQCDKKSPGGVT